MMIRDKEKNILGIDNKNIKIIFIIICFCIPFININKGLDVTDTGYILNSYEFVFKNPESINFSIIFTSIFGNIILKILNVINIPSYLGFKLISVIFSLIICFILIKYLKRYFNENILIIGAIIALLLSKGHISILMYNNLSAFILSISSIILISGIIENKNRNIFISGILIGINTFVRISNLVQLVLIFSIIYYGWKKKDRNYTIKTCLLFFIGIIFSLVFSLTLIILVFGKTELFSMISIYVSEAVNSSDSHSIMDSIKINLNQGLNGLFWILFLWAIAYIIDYFLKDKNISSKSIKRIYLIMVIIPIIFVIFKFIGLDNVIIINLFYKIFYSLYQPFSICVAFYCLVTIYKCFITKEYDLIENIILMVGFLSMISLPIGSNQGFAILYQGFYLQSIILTGVIYKLFIDNNRGRTIEYKNLIFQKGIIIFISVYFLSMLVVRNVYYVYRDNSKLDKYSINSEKLRGIYTTKERANYINDLLNNIGVYIDSENSLITYGSIPLFSYLLDMPPFFEGFNGWIEMGQLSIESMEATIYESKEKEIYPLIIMSKVGTNNNNWPVNNTIDIMEQIRKDDNKYRLLEEYIKDNNYNLVFQNEMFEVYSNNLRALEE